MKKIKTKLLCSAFLFSSALMFAEPAVKYISPNNDGVQDTLDIPLQIKDKRYVMSWALVITNENGDIVRTITNKRKDDEAFSFKGLWNRVTSAKKGVDVPDTVSWNGFLGDEAEAIGLTSGSVAPDGVYYYYVAASDDNGNTSTTPKYKVIVDTVTPEVHIKNMSDEEKTFGEGSKSSLKIVQSGSEEQLWEGSILDAQGNVIRSYEWKSSAPKDFEWNELTKLLSFLGFHLIPQAKTGGSRRCFENKDGVKLYFHEHHLFCRKA